MLRPEYHRQAIADLTGGDGQETWWHNKVYDGLALEESVGLDFDATMSGAEDTDTLHRLIDPRPPMKGGVGHKLEDLGNVFIPGAEKKDARAAILEAGKKRFGVREFTKDNMWGLIPVEDPTYNIYAGQDVFITARLVPIFKAEAKQLGLDRMYTYERALSVRLAQMQRIGIGFDPVWADRVEAEYDEIYEQFEAELAEEWEVVKGGQFYHSARKGLTQRFEQLGVKWQKFSEKTGDPSLDKAVIRELVQFGRTQNIKGLASAVQSARVNKHYGDYVRGMRAALGHDGRIHPNVRPMQAATHRMSISDPPIQQFPRDDPRIRGCLIPDKGEVLISADYAQVELRVAAALSQDPVMIETIRAGDIHGVAAGAMFGMDYNKDQRQASKAVAFGRIYLGGAPGIYKALAESDTTGYLPSLSQVRLGTKAFDTRFQRYMRYAKGLKDIAERSDGILHTATGRRLIVSPSYAAPNYMIQSVARDILAAGINKAWKAGLGDNIRLVVHDEIVAAAPKREAKKVMALLVDCMKTTFKGVPIDVEASILGERWKK